MAEESRDLMIEQGIEEGWITPASRKCLRPARRFVAPQSIADVLAEDRGKTDLT